MSDAVKPPGGGNSKYVFIGVLLLLGAVGVAVFLSPSDEPAPTPPPVAAPPQEVERVNPMAQPDLILEDEEEEDAAVEEPSEEPKTTKSARPAPRDNWDCSGDLDRSALQAVIRQHRAQVRTCYERRLKVNNLLQGEVSLKIKVGANGKVVTTAASGSLTDAEVLSCMRRQAGTWRFPSPTGGKCAVIAVPFQFSPKN